MKLKQLIFLVLGCTCLVLGCIGIVLPILPTVPFFLVTVFCFANSSQKLHNWFVGTKMYKKHLESFVKKKGMTIKTKFGILIPVTIVMGIGFFLMMRGGILVPSVILAIVWVCHIIYFGFGVKTLSTADTEKYMRLAERYPFQKIFRIAEEKDKTDAQALEKVFADAVYMEAVVDLKAKAPAVYLYLNKDVPDDTLCGMAAGQGYILIPLQKKKVRKKL